VIESDIYIYEKRTKLVVADPAERKRWQTIGLRRLMRESGLSQTTVYKILTGRPVRRYILYHFKQVVTLVQNWLSDLKR